MQQSRNLTQEETIALVTALGFVEGVDWGSWPEHDWQKLRNGDPDDHAWEDENHMGRRCDRCGHSYCVWCYKDGDDEPCEIWAEQCLWHGSFLSRLSDEQRALLDQKLPLSEYLMSSYADNQFKLRRAAYEVVFG